MRMVLIIILSLFLISVSLAKHESLIMGPYQVSFDLNTTKEYRVNNTTAKHSETYCGAKYDTYTTLLNNNNEFALITVAYFVDKMNKSYDTKSNENFLEGLKYHDIKTYNRTIDNQSGILSVGENSNGDCMFAVQYWPTFNTSGYTNVLIESNYPWNNEMLDLLKTIRVELICNTTVNCEKFV